MPASHAQPIARRLIAGAFAVLLASALLLFGACASEPADNPSQSQDSALDASSAVSSPSAISNGEPEASAEADSPLSANAPSDTSASGTGVAHLEKRKRVYVPLSWDVTQAHLVGRQGTTALWGACGECAVANSLNLVTGSAYSEADIVYFALDHGLCDPSTGGMTLQNMARSAPLTFTGR